jgi:hypothetical protein
MILRVVLLGGGFVWILLFGRPDHELWFACLIPVMMGFANRHPWKGMPKGVGPAPTTLRHDLAASLLVATVASLALLVRAL